jgi:hypothetical protein
MDEVEFHSKRIKNLEQFRDDHKHLLQLQRKELDELLAKINDLEQGVQGNKNKEKLFEQFFQVCYKDPYYIYEGSCIT